MTLRVMDYKATLNLPKTAFPMKANLPKTEPEMLAWWESFGIYKRIRQASASRHYGSCTTDRRTRTVTSTSGRC